MTELLHYPFSIVQYFIPEFITRMRSRREVEEKPSPRQGIAMCDLLVPVYLRKGELSIQNLVDVAVSTSKVENQDLAQRIALEVLLEVEESEEPPRYDDDALLGLINQKSDDLISYDSMEDQHLGQGEVQPDPDSNVDLFQKYSLKPDIGVGEGEDELLMIAIRENKDSRDESSRRRLAEFLKVKLLKLAREFERNTEMQRKHILRPYEYGDDPEDIDEERSMENIFDQGKRMEEVGYNDFFIRKKDKKRKAIIFILDISNTMFYQLEGLTSIHYSVMSLVPLLWSLRQERYGMILYESNSHVQKDIFEEADVDEIIDRLLILVTSSTGDLERLFRGTSSSQTWGGTVPNQSLKWAKEQLQDLSERTEKICFFFSDFVLDEPGNLPPEKMENYAFIDSMIQKGIKVVACISPLAKEDIFTPYTEKALKLLRESGCEMIETHRPSDFLDDVQVFLESV